MVKEGGVLRHLFTLLVPPVVADIEVSRVVAKPVHAQHEHQAMLWLPLLWLWLPLLLLLPLPLLCPPVEVRPELVAPARQ